MTSRQHHFAGGQSIKKQKYTTENLKNERRMLKLTRKRKRNNNDNDSSIFKKLSTYLGDGIPIFIETVQQQRHQVSKRENITW